MDQNRKNPDWIRYVLLKYKNNSQIEKMSKEDFLIKKKTIKYIKQNFSLSKIKLLDPVK